MRDGGGAGIKGRLGFGGGGFLPLPGQPSWVRLGLRDHHQHADSFRRRLFVATHTGKRGEVAEDVKAVPRYGQRAEMMGDERARKDRRCWGALPHKSRPPRSHQRVCSYLSGGE